MIVVGLSETERLMVRNRMLAGAAAEFVDAGTATFLSHHLAPIIVQIRDSAGPPANMLTIDNVVSRLEGHGVDPDVVDHFRSLKR